MRKVGNLFEQVLDRDNLRLAFAKALRGKRHRADARRFADNLDVNLKNMAWESAHRRLPFRPVLPVRCPRSQDAADHSTVLRGAGSAPRNYEYL